MIKKLQGFYLFLAFSIIPLVAGAEGRFQGFEFKLRGGVNDVINEDIDGDGLLDVLAIHVDRAAHPPKRFLSIFIQDKKTGFSDENKIEWDVPQKVAAIDIGDVSPEKGQELVVITEEGVFSASIMRGKVGPLSPIIQVQSVVAIAPEKELPYYNFVWDYTGDGLDDILVCGFYDALFARHNGDYNFTSQKIKLRPDINIIALDISALMVTPEHPILMLAYRVPQVYSADYNADGLVDLIVCFRNKVEIFAQGKDGFTHDPVKQYRIRLFDEKAERRGPPPAIDFEDIDQDGKVDIVAYQISGTIGNMKSRSVLYWGNSKNIEKDIPDLEFETEHTVMGKVIIWDANGDGLHDLIMPTYDISAWNLGKILFTGEITVIWDYFIQSKDHKFNTIPERKITTDMKMNLRKFRLESGIPNVVADFNGDGYPDQALGEDEKVLNITLRDAQGQPMPTKEKIDVPIPIFYRAVDLNTDGLSDILIYYIEKDEYRGDLRIFLNRGPWTMEEPENIK